MKKSIFLTLLIATAIAVSPVKAQFSIGPGVVYATELENVGISGVLNYDFANRIGLMGGFTYFLEKDNVNWWAIDLDATYNFYSVQERGSVYALAGVNFLVVKADYDPLDPDDIFDDNITGFNIGVGWKIGDGVIKLVPEVRYTIGEVDYLRVGVKLMFGM